VKQKANLSADNLDVRKLSINGNYIEAFSLSPDGRYAAYNMDDQERYGIWIRQMATGVSRLVIPLAESTRVWGLGYSRDGDFLYYLIEDMKQPVGGMLYRMSTLGGAPQKLLTGINGMAILSPDGRRMVFKRYDQGKNFLKLANADGSDVQDLDSSDSSNDYYGYDWSPSGESIIYINSNQDAEDRYWRIVEKPVNGAAAKFWTEKLRSEMTGMGSLPAGRGLTLIMADPKTRLQQIWRLPAPGAEARQITHDTSNYSPGSLSLTADGKMLLTRTVDRPSRVSVAPVSDLAHPKQISPRYAYYDDLAWTPAGELVYSLVDNGGSNLWITKADGSEPRQLTADASLNSYAAVSPDGRFIVFVSDRDGKRTLMRTDQNGSQPLKLTNEDSFYPNISPDGQWVYFVAWRYGDSSLWRVSISGGEPMAVVDPPSGRPAISPDGRLLAHTYFDRQLKRRRVVVRSLADGAQFKNFDANIGYGTLRWLHDGSGIAYVRGKNEIVAQPLTGAPPRSLLTSADEWIFSFDLSRDGQWVAYLSGRLTTDLVLIRDFLPDDAARR
jgi:Tol biopolymer transport system component